MSSDILKLMEQDIIDPILDQVAYSQEDKRFLTILEKGIKYHDGHYELPLPFRNGRPALRNNTSVALERLNPLTRRFNSDARFRQDYFCFLQNLLTCSNGQGIDNIWQLE